MKDRSQKSTPKVSEHTHNAISSRVSGVGHMRSSSLITQQMSLFGPDHAHVNPFRAPGNKKDTKTKDTSGQYGTNSSRSFNLQRSLANRLVQNLDVNGSPDYALTWKVWDMQSGPPICRLLASQRRTKETGYSGWPTARSCLALSAIYTKEAIENSRKSFPNLETVIQQRFGMNCVGLVTSPVFVLNLMGYPAEWAYCVVPAMQSSHR